MEVLDLIRNSQTKKIKIAVTDIDGILRGKYLHKEKFLASAKSGIGFCNVVFGWDSSDACYDNTDYTGWHSGYPDAMARIDLSTHRNVPWDQEIDFFLGDFVGADSKPLPVCPRQLLRRVVEKAGKMGYVPLNGMEFEWFNFSETSKSIHEKKFTNLQALSPGMFGYSLVRMNQNQGFFHALLDEMERFRVPLEGLHTETGPGVLEAAILYTDALECADRAVLFKSGAKEIGNRFGILPTFMAKWNKALPGCSGHMHQSLWDAKRATNLFHDEKHPNKMSPVFQSYLAGILKFLPEMLPFYAPTVNSYKRLVDGYWAPTKATWGIDNRTVACRVIPGSAKSTRVEVRIPGSDVNPYLSIAASIACGLYGIEKNLALEPKQVLGSAYADTSIERLPRNLFLATEKLKESRIAREIMGGEFVDHFVQTREWEWRQYQDSVSSWELERYLEII